MPEAGRGGDGSLPDPTLNDLPISNPSVPLPPILDVKKEQTQWNTSRLPLRLGADACAAAGASILVSPLICLIDRSIVSKASTGAPFSSTFLTALRPTMLRPVSFIGSTPFKLVFALYFGTYFTANCVDTATSTLHSRPADRVSSGTAKFIATSAVNMSLCIYKDRCFARMFGGGSSGSPIPKISYALFAARDSLTIFASFNLPSLIAPRLAHLPPSIKSSFSRILSTDGSRLNTAQFLAPAVMQVFSTPIYLLGLDLFNRQGRLGFADRFARIRRDWGVSALARMGRIVPAFGVGGVVNAGVRRGLMQKLE